MKFYQVKINIKLVLEGWCTVHIPVVCIANTEGTYAFYCITQLFDRYPCSNSCKFDSLLSG